MDNAVTTPPFSWGKFILGLILALFVGFIGAFFAGLLSADMQMAAICWLIVSAPGLIIGALGLWVRGRGGLGEGLVIGGCIVALIGGICGQAMSSGLDFK